MEFSWPMVGAISTISVATGVVALLWLRAALAKDFTPNTAFSELSAQVRKMEHDLRAAPTHTDFKSLGERVGRVEVGVAVVQETVSSLKEGVGRIDRGVDRIEKHLLEGGK